MKLELQLNDPNVFPDEIVIQEALGNTFKFYSGFVELYKSLNLDHEWKYYNDGKSWLCKILNKKHTIVWMSIWNELLKIVIYFPLSKIDLLMDLSITPEIKERINSTDNIGKSKPCLFEIKDDSEFNEIKKIMELKIRTK